MVGKVSGTGLVIAAAIAFGAGPAFAQSAACKLAAEESPHVQGCKVIVGYSGGKRVGEFRIAEGFDRKEVGTSEACRLNSRYYKEPGAIMAPDKVRVGKRIFTLSADCLSSTEK